MTQVAELEHEYVGCPIEVIGFTEPRKLAARVDIWPPGTRKEDDDAQVFFIEQLSATVKRRSRDWPDDNVQAVQQVMDRALHRARGAILLDRVEGLAGATFTIPGSENFAQRSEEFLRGLVLNAFKRAFEHDSSQGGRIDFDDVGVALMEDVDPKRMEYILARLQGDGLIAMAGVRQEAGHRYYKPTPAGLTEADRLSQPGDATGLLVEETVATVERILNKYRPEVTESLRRQAVRVAEAREMDEHEVGEVAHACEQIIWDALDLDAFWEGIADARPAREKTRDRLRLILKARVPSGTEQELLEGLEQYVVGWFGPLEQFIHKHRKLPKESDRAHGRRIVVYTYMLLGDLMELCGL